MAFSSEETNRNASQKCVSVGLLVYNLSDRLQEAISSTLAQAECLELYILFSAKIEEKLTRRCCQKSRDHRITFLHDKGNNLIKLANQVASTFKGEFYIFLKEVDVMHADALCITLRHLRQQSRYVLAYGLSDIIDDNSGNRQSFKSLKPTENILRFSEGSSMALATILIKRSAWLLLGGFDESLSSCFELDFAIRAYKAFSDRILFIERIQAETMCLQDENRQIESLLESSFESYSILKRHNLNANEFLRNSISRIIKRIATIDELGSFLNKSQKYINAHDKYLNESFKKAAAEIALFDEFNIDHITQMEEKGLTHYEKDGLAANLISAISLQMYSGYFANTQGPYQTYTSLRNIYSESIAYIKHFEKCSLLVKGRKISSGYRDRPFGVNLIGHAFDVFGLGEALRMVAKALIAADIPLCIIDIPACNGSARENNFLEDYVKTDFSGIAPYAFNIVCMSPSSHAKWLLDEGLNLSLGRYSISTWFWETSTWPTPWESIFQFVDAAWAFSSLIHEALLPHCKKNNVVLEKAQFPAQIDAEEILQRPHSTQYYRSRFNLPDDKIIFIFSFDPKSQIDRKNPLTCVRVFNKAFGDKFSQNQRTDVCLVIKTFQPEKYTEEWGTLMSLISSDKRIILITDSLERSDILGLYSCCDVFLSLHRTEGYGLGIAEALQLGLRIVATGYGGNVDFCRGDSTYLVDYTLVPIPHGSYPLSIGHYWAEPDIENATQACQKVVIDIKEKPSEFIKGMSEELFATSTSGESFRRSLEQAYHAPM